MQEMQVQSLGQEDPLEKEMATHSHILAWEIPWTEELADYSPLGCKTVWYYWPGLKLNIKKIRHGIKSITSWQTEGEKVEKVTDFIFMGSNITADGDGGMNSEAAPGRRKPWQTHTGC